jgi:hypothetical protein
MTTKSNTMSTGSHVTGHSSTGISTSPGGSVRRALFGHGGPVTGRRTAGVLAAVALVVTAACGSSADAHPIPARTAPAVVDVATPKAAAAPCLHSADAVQHWSEVAGQAACVQALRERARVTLGLTVEPSSASTWVCPTTADAAEHWVRAIGAAGCRR